MSTIFIVVMVIVNVFLGLSIVNINREFKFYREMYNINYDEIRKIRKEQMESKQAEFDYLQERGILNKQLREELNRYKDLDDQISVQLELFKDYVVKTREQLVFLEEAMASKKFF